MTENEISQAIIGAAIEVHRALGPGLIEQAYEEALCHELQLRGLEVQRQLTFAIEYKGGLCGIAGLLKHADIYRNTAEIGYWIGEPYWNKGIATRAVKLLTEYGLDHLNYARLQTGIFEYNTSSMKVLEKCGYRLEGVFQKSLTKHGRLWDEYRYGIINPKA